MLLPDERQADVFRNEIRENLVPGDVLVAAHGFNLHFGRLDLPDGVAAVLVSPNGPGSLCAFGNPLRPGRAVSDCPCTGKGGSMATSRSSTGPSTSTTRRVATARPSGLMPSAANTRRPRGTGPHFKLPIRAKHDAQPGFATGRRAVDRQVSKFFSGAVHHAPANGERRALDGPDLHPRNRRAGGYIEDFRRFRIQGGAIVGGLERFGLLSGEVPHSSRREGHRQDVIPARLQAGQPELTQVIGNTNAAGGRNTVELLPAVDIGDSRRGYHEISAGLPIRLHDAAGDDSLWLQPENDSGPGFPGRQVERRAGRAGAPRAVDALRYPARSALKM